MQIYLVKAGELKTCPHILVTVETCHTKPCVTAAHRCDSLVKIASQELVRNGIGVETLPVQSALNKSALGHKTTRINKQMLVPFEID